LTANVSVVLPTYNRKASLRRALDSVLAQKTHSRYDVIVVDNNSTDGTREEVEAVAAAAPVRVRYLLQERQGVSHARNAGIDAAADAAIVAFVDDDVRVQPDWLEAIVRAFEAHPEVDCIGGKVLPDWEESPPAWLTRDHWAPVALLDMGAAIRAIDADHRYCLLTANMACRRETFERIGGFRPDLQRVKGSIGSLEDHEWMVRFWTAGGRGLYIPELSAVTEVPRARLTKGYHRRWHTGHGHYFALMREPDFESSTRGRLLDVPAHAYRSAIGDALGWAGRLLRLDTAGAFLLETRLRFFASYFRTRSAEYLSGVPLASVLRRSR
jgi:glycosyltransferase involved in cell wall biosynthesis